MNNKTLALIFLALAAIYILRKTLGKPEVRSIPEYLVQIDTSSVDKILLTPKDKSGDPVELVKENGVWNASNGQKTVVANPGSIKNLLSALGEIAPKQLVSKNPERWLDYEVTPETASQVECYAGSKKKTGFYVGRFNFDQATRTATSYMRMDDEDDIYSVDGFLSMSFNQDFSNFRDKQLTKAKSTDVERLTLTSDNDELSIEKSISGQWIDQAAMPLDSAKTANYVNTLMLTSGTEFDDDFNSDAFSPAEKLEILLNNGQTVTFSVYEDETGLQKPFILHSSDNKDAWFRSDSAGIYKRVITNFKDLVK